MKFVKLVLLIGFSTLASAVYGMQELLNRLPGETDQARLEIWTAISGQVDGANAEAITALSRVLNFDYASLGFNTNTADNLAVLKQVLSGKVRAQALAFTDVVRKAGVVARRSQPRADSGLVAQTRTELARNSEAVQALVEGFRMQRLTLQRLFAASEVATTQIQGALIEQRVESDGLIDRLTEATATIAELRAAIELMQAQMARNEETLNGLKN